MRSVPPLGTGWYFPAGPGGYFSYKTNSVYRSILRVGLRIGDKVLFEEAAGPVFVLNVDHPVDSHFVATDTAMKAWMAGEGTSTPVTTTYYPDALNSALSFRASVGPGAKRVGNVLLSRAVNDRFAKREVSASALRAESVYAERIADDGRFWAGRHA